MEEEAKRDREEIIQIHKIFFSFGCKCMNVDERNILLVDDDQVDDYSIV